VFQAYRGGAENRRREGRLIGWRETRGRFLKSMNERTSTRMSKRKKDRRSGQWKSQDLQIDILI